MERLTRRDSHGCAYFDNDGALIRGANGAFHQKKDMTAHYIHDRFVALDKAIDRLAAYEDALPLERVEELAQAEKDGRLVVLPDAKYTDADGEKALKKAMWTCWNTNNPITRYTADAIAEKLCREARNENPPLTLEELREMDGEPVWVEYIPSPSEECTGLWALVSVDKEYDEIFLLNSIGGSSSYEEAFADIRAVYRHRPGEAE